MSVVESFSKLDGFKKRIKQLKIERDIDSVLKLDFPYFEKQERFALICLPTYAENDQKNILIMTRGKLIVYSNLKFNDLDKKHRSISKRRDVNSTVTILTFLKNILRNYSEQFQGIRTWMNDLDMDPLLSKVEEAGRALRRLTDRLEGLLEIIIVIKEREIKEFNTELISFDYDVLNTETRYWLERCRSHIYRIATLRTKSEMRANKQLNDTMGRLTVIMTILTIVSIVVSVPGTIGAIFGIPALSDAYFSPNTPLLVLVLIGATLLSIILGYAYWKSLGLRYVKPK